MDYKKAYEEALEKARYIKENCDCVNAKYIGSLFEQVFPELCESDDERIRKEIKAYINRHYPVDSPVMNKSKILNWLEKQGKKSEYDPYKVTVESIADMCKTDVSSIDLVDFYGNVKVKCKEAIDYDKTWTEKQGEQKPTDEVKPKFKVGDWVVSPNGVYWHIDAIQDSRYQVSSDLGNCADWPLNTNIYHKFTIQDAKVGDVLYCKNYGIEFIVMNKGVNENDNIDSYFRYNSEAGFDIDVSSVLSANGDNITPATKEQRDFLFKKMHEVGYEWDAEKKELKKISQEYPLTPDECIKSVWREKDEYNLSTIIGSINYDDRKNEAEKSEQVQWLKSLKPQSNWRPTKDQLEAFEHFVRSIGDSGYASPYDERTKNLQSLLYNLKNL